MELATRSPAYVLAPTAVLLIVSAFLVFVSSERLRASRGLVEHANDVIATARSLLTSVQDAETGQRGYILSEQAAYLEPYRAAMIHIPALTGKLRELTRADSDQQQRINALSEAIGRKLGELKSTLETFTSSGFAAARSEVMTDVGLQAMVDVRRILDEIVASERTLLAARIAAADKAEWRTLLVALTAMAAALMALAIAHMLLVRRNQQLRLAKATAADKAGLLQATLDHTREGIAAWDASGRLRAFNLRFFEELELPPELAAEGTSIETVLARDEGRTPAALAFVRTRDALGSDDVMFRGRIGERSIEIGAHPTSNGGFLLSSINVTRRVQAEEVAAQAQKMEAIGHLTGGIAHDFNNLLQIIRSNLDLLAPRVAADPKATRRVENAILGTERGAQLTRQLLAFARRQPLEPKAVNLGRTVDDMADLLRRTLGERIEIEAAISRGLWNTLADPAQIENAILNLALNARDAMPEGGKLTIELSNTALDQAYAALHPEITAGQYVLLAVTDTGVGMPPDIVARAFEPFFTTKLEGQGTGLGLAQVYGFVRQSGGHIKIESEVGRGTAVRIYLPRTLREPESLPAMTRATTERGHQRILVVEDEEEVRLGAVEMLESLGYRVSEAANGDQALAMLSQAPAVDLLFTDVVMPGSTKAADLARRAKELRIAVLFASGYTENALIRNHQLDPGVRLLSKPYRRDDLARKVSAVLAEAAQQSRGTDGPATHPQAAQRKLRVLVAEDDPMVRMTTVGLLTELGHYAMEAANGREALQQLDSGHRVDLLLADIGLPDMSGEDLAAECLRRQSNVAVIFATGYDAAAKKGANVAGIFLGKPFATADLERAIERAIAKSPSDSGSEPADQRPSEARVRLRNS